MDKTPFKENEKKHLHFDCFSGISGDMIIASLLDLGGLKDDFISTMKQLPIDGLKINVVKSQRSHIGCSDVKFQFSPQPLRHLSDILNIIEAAPFSDWVKSKSAEVLNKIANAEAAVHQVSKEKIHFHEIGAADTILDICGTFFLLEKLGRPECSASSLNVGSGTVETEHGILPVPAPATVKLLKGIPFYFSETEGELVTPTGAALITTITQTFSSIPSFLVEQDGYGAGDNEYEGQPNLLRVLYGKKANEPNIESLLLLQINLDDFNPENYMYVMDRLFKEGAKDVTLTPIYMKKNRPGTMLSVLIDNELREKMERIIFTETTTLGIRALPVERKCLERKFITVKIRNNEIRIKIGLINGKQHIFHPEYEDCVAAAKKTGLPLRVIQEKAIQKIKNVNV